MYDDISMTAFFEYKLIFLPEIVTYFSNPLKKCGLCILQLV